MLAASAVAASCGGGTGTSGTTTTAHGGQGGTGHSTGGEGHAGSGGGIFITSSSSGGGGQQQGFDVQPSAQQTVTVNIGQTMPTVTYTATLDGKPINAGWSVDQGAIGSIPAGPSTTADFSPSGKVGGVVTVRAGLNNQTLNRTILVKLVGQQNGPNPNDPLEQGQIAMTPADLTAGGGIGGVGGEGLGVEVTDPAAITALGAPSSDGSAEGLKLLYPYDKTVWPRGMLAPLLQWESTLGDVDAIQIELATTTGSFSWKGTFGKPAILAQTGGKFVRHPIPQDIWQAATNTASGLNDQLTVKLTVALGGQAYGPIAQTWTVAPARLSGIVYYNSYGTSLAKNYGGAIGGGDGLFGGAVLSIRVGDTGPKLVAGGNPGVPDDKSCRVCHSVSANGSRLVVSKGENYNALTAFDLSPSGATAQSYGTAGPWFPGVSPDGSLALASDGQLWPLPNTGTSTPSTGLPAAPIGMPAFSPDGKLVAFNLGSGGLLSNQLAVMSFDAATSTFSNQVTVVDDTTAPGWPAFFPDGKSVVFERESANGGDGHSQALLWTRGAAKGQIAWTSATDAAHMAVLNQLNGLDGNGNSYLPKVTTPAAITCKWNGGATAFVHQIDPDHGDDVNVNYEPTVNPVASGGYAWVVFTSRRMYGNVATIPPFCSDPRWVDLYHNVTPKKLWVAAVDINGAPGTDPSHPAFYLPAQELMAGNSRGFWTLDPCRADGQGCESGDQCCNGFCQPNGPNGDLVCSDKPPGSTCSMPQEKCTTAADCCDTSNLCVNGFCTVKGPS